MDMIHLFSTFQIIWSELRQSNVADISGIYAFLNGTDSISISIRTFISDYPFLFTGTQIALW